MLRYIRIAILLTVLLIVAGNQYLTENRFSRWEKPLWVTIYPVLADNDSDVRHYVKGLNVKSFNDIGEFFQQQAAHFGRQFDTPIIIQLADPLTDLPPALPNENSGLSIVLWSLKMRLWAWMHSGQDGLAPDDVRMFVLYQKDKPIGKLERSVGIKKGSYGVVNAVATRQTAALNRVVITHELLHILGASDKYNLMTGQPVSPDGLANPGRVPLYPQSMAEIMGGRVAISPDRWRLPPGLRSCVIGEKTAAEINWL